MSRELCTANHATAKVVTAAARANRTARGFGGGVYPITPQTECIELLCDQEIEKGHVVRVESEHSAMAVCMGFSLGGARSFTASSSNGLAYMAENVYAAAFYRLPIVMMAVNRTLGPPWNIWVDHGDTLMLRDSGWIQLYCEDNQEVADTILAAFRLAEDPRILLPVLVCQDAFILSHTMTMTDIPEQDVVDRFLPPLDLPHRLTDAPRTVGQLDFPHETEAHRFHLAEAMERVFTVYPEISMTFEAELGRPLAPIVVPDRLEDAETVVVSMGTTASTVRASVDTAREAGGRVGSLRIRMFRPFPREEIRRQLAGKKRIAVLDRDLSPGLGGVLASEILAAVDSDAIVQGYVLGLGGGDVRTAHIDAVLEEIAGRTKAGAPVLMEVAR